MEHQKLIEPERINEIQFIYNQKYLQYDDITTIGQYFMNDNSPIIQVNDFDEILLEEPFTSYDITFETSLGYTSVYNSEINITMKDIIFKYLSYIDQPELINNRDKIIFLYNGEKINENITARKCFKTQTKPKIIVIDNNNLLINSLKFNGKNLGKTNVLFWTTNDQKTVFAFNISTTKDEMLKKYLLKINHPEYINDNKIRLLYNGKAINYGDKTVLGRLFSNAIIEVMGI